MFKSIQKIFKKIWNNSTLSIILIIGGMWVFRGVLILNQAFPFNADEAIVGLMAKHILAGERPIFFYGQVYMGSLDAYLIAFFFKLFGVQVFWIRFVQVTLFSITLLEFFLFTQIVFENKLITFTSTLFLAFPVVNVVLYTTVSLGGYGEAFVLGMAVLLLAALFVKTNWILSNPQKMRLLPLVGLTMGLGLWANALSLLLAVPAVMMILITIIKNKCGIWILFKQLVLIGIGFLVGASFWIYGFFNNGGVLVEEMFGSAVSVETFSFWDRVINHLVSFFLFAPTVVFGFRPPWSVDWILLALIPLVILFWIITIKKTIKSQYSSFQIMAIITVVGSGVLVFIGFVFTSFGVDPSGRYFLPFVFLLSMMVGLALNANRSDKLYLGLFVFVLVYQMAGSLILMNKQPKITTQFFKPAQVQQEYMPELVDFLISKNEFFGYSNYWVSYPLAFLSDEKIISIPRLPYHPDLTYTSRDNRIPNYELSGLENERVFYITTHNPALDQVLRNAFNQLDIHYKFHQIGDYLIYYELSEKIEPEQLVEFGLYR